jgi:hypothetical protein
MVLPCAFLATAVYMAAEGHKSRGRLLQASRAPCADRKPCAMQHQFVGNGIANPPRATCHYRPQIVAGFHDLYLSSPKGPKDLSSNISVPITLGIMVPEQWLLGASRSSVLH